MRNRSVIISWYLLGYCMIHSLNAQLTIENHSQAPIYIRQITYLESQGIDPVPVPHSKEIVVLPGQSIGEKELNPHALHIAEITLLINGLVHRFSIANDQSQASILRIAPNFLIELFGPIQRLNYYRNVPSALARGLYAV